MVVCFADGGCSPNPGPGGWGVVILDPDGRVEMRGGARDSTNNRMELTAAIRALAHFPEGAEIEMRCDSQYVVKAASEWIRGWKAKGWRSTTGDVKNRDLMEQLDALAGKRRVRWTWVRGHSGDRWNERADALVHMGRNEAAVGKGDTVQTFASDKEAEAPHAAVSNAPAPSRTAPVEIDLELGLLVSRAAKGGGVTPRDFVEQACRLALALGPEEVRRLCGAGRAA